MLETLLLIVFMASDILLFYIFFESILPPLFLLIGLFGSDNKVNEMCVGFPPFFAIIFDILHIISCIIATILRKS